MRLSPSLYAADPLRLHEAIAAVAPFSGSLHIDIMDGRFAPAFGLSQGLIPRLLREYTIPIDVHLMVDDPETWAEHFAELGVRSVAFHLEAVRAPEALIHAVKRAGARAYLALLPDTPIEEAEAFQHSADGFLLLTAPPGGGLFSNAALARLDQIPSAVPVIVDGSLRPEHLKMPILSRVELAVVGRSLFDSHDIALCARQLANTLNL